MEGLSRYNSISPILIQQFKEVDKKKTIGQKIKKLAVQIFSKYKADDARKKDLLMHQGHLAREGSNLSEMTNHFINSLRGKPGADKFVKELESMHKIEEKETDFNQVAIRLGQKLVDLKPGDSFLIEHRSSKARHAMIMRVVKNEDESFMLLRTNTGAGVSDQRLHPIQENEKGQKLTQLTTVWNNLTSQDILTFYVNFEATSRSGNIPTKTLAAMSFNNEQLDTINQGNEDLSLIKKFNELSLHCLGRPQQISIEQNPQCFGKKQLGGSCTASCLWEASKFSMTKEARDMAKVEGGLGQLLHNYTLYKQGYDRSLTNKMMILDQVERLKHQLKTEDDLSDIKEILEKIENKLEKSSKKIISEQRFYNNMIQPSLSPKNKPVNIKIIRIGLKKKENQTIDASNTQTVRYKSDKFFHIKFERNEKGIPIGQHLHEDAYLLCFHTATGNDKKAAFYAERITSHTYPNNVVVDREIAKEVCLISMKLATDIYHHDTSRTGLAKAEFFFSLTGKIAENNDFSEYKQDINTGRRQIVRNRIQQQDLAAYLGEDNVWLKSL